MTPIVSELADRAEITSLVARYFGAIDDKRLDRATMEAVFTTSGCLTTFCWSCDIARVGLALESARRAGGGNELNGWANLFECDPVLE